VEGNRNEKVNKKGDQSEEKERKGAMQFKLRNNDTQV
jgi:hypothetical protein